MSPQLRAERDRLLAALVEWINRGPNPIEAKLPVGCGKTRLGKIELLPCETRFADASPRRRVAWLVESLTVRSRLKQYSMIAYIRMATAAGGEPQFSLRFETANGEAWSARIGYKEKRRGYYAISAPRFRRVSVSRIFGS